MNVRIKGFLQCTTQKYALREVVQSLSTSYAEEPCKTLLHHLAAQQPPLPKVFQDQQCHDAFKILVFDFLCCSLYTTIHAGWFSSRLKTSWNGELPVWKVSTSILAKPPTKQHINRKIALFSPSLHSTPGSLTGRTGNMVEWGWMVGKRGCDVVKLETLFKKSYKSWHAEYRNIPFITQFHTSQADRAKGISSNRQNSPTLKWWSLAKKTMEWGLIDGCRLDIWGFIKKKTSFQSHLRGR